MGKSLLNGATVLITGTSSGIGYELARQTALRGAAQIILVARRKEKLDELKALIAKEAPRCAVAIHSVDLREQSAITGLVEALKTQGFKINVLMNNAGHGDFRFMTRSSLEKLRSMVELNVWAPTQLMYQLLPQITAAGARRGGILNVSSTLGHMAMPGLAVYTATKHYLTGLTECLHAELASTGAVICQSCPGPVATEFEGAANATQDRVSMMLLISAAQCARESLDAFEAGRAMVIPGRAMRFAMLVTGLIPRAFLRRGLAQSAARLERLQQGG